MWLINYQTRESLSPDIVPDLQASDSASCMNLSLPHVRNNKMLISLGMIRVSTYPLVQLTGITWSPKITIHRSKRQPLSPSPLPNLKYFKTLLPMSGTSTTRRTDIGWSGKSESGFLTSRTAKLWTGVQEKSWRQLLIPGFQCGQNVRVTR